MKFLGYERWFNVLLSSEVGPAEGFSAAGAFKALFEIDEAEQTDDHCDWF